MILELIIWTVGLAFAAITVLTIGNIFSFGPVVSRFRVKPEYEAQLFYVLIVEIITICLGVGGLALDDREQINQRKIEAEAALELSLEAWEAISRVWMDEPSGLTHSGLSDSSSLGPVLVGVDDEEPAVFVLDTGPGHFPLVRAYLKLVGQDGKPISDDLEAVAYDGSRYYYALASHRRLGGKSKARKTRKLLKFEIPPLGWQDGYAEISIGSPIDLTSLENGKRDLGKLLSDAGVDVSDWDNKGALPHPFGLEIEGMVYHGGKLYLGLKWPLDHDSALLLGYDIGKGQFDWIRRLDLNDDINLVPHGITGLAISGDHLLVASNPPHKVDGEEDAASVQYYGRSGLWAFSLNAIESAKEDMPVKGTRLQLEPESGTKLEGIAVVGAGLYLIFEGDHPVFRIADLPTTYGPR